MPCTNTSLFLLCIPRLPHLMWQPRNAEELSGHLCCPENGLYVGPKYALQFMTSISLENCRFLFLRKTSLNVMHSCLSGTVVTMCMDMYTTL